MKKNTIRTALHLTGWIPLLSPNQQ